MLQNNTTTDYDYESPGPYMTIQFASEYDMREALKYMYMGMYSIIILLGLPLNTLVIYTIFCKMKRTGRVIWFLGLAVTDLTVCLFLPFQIVSALDDFNWRFGRGLCKFCSFVMFVNMHSTALMLSFMSTDRCLSALVSRACCKSFVSKSMVLLSWTIGTLLSIPSFLFRSVKDTDNGQSCIDDYKTTAEGALA
ncbi:chemokine-like receptor 1 [Megalops cyprinoides]|uniref:chemokine-like receptor 1 n=1 Tax=Megalops cyprinoides TaxID=118141 RepID=UPI001864BD00|nr:chemokine-like receptor 1 [Megalops cyprinoides]